MVPVTVVIIIDALGFEVVSRHNFHPDGFTKKIRLRTVLGFSQAALTSIMTGLPPGMHGLWMMYSFASAGSPFAFLRLIPASISSERLWLRRLIRWKLRHIDRVRSYYSLYSVPRPVLRDLNLPARRDIFAPGGADGCRTIMDELERRAVKVFVRDYKSPESVAFEELEAALREGGAGFYLLYTAGLDSVMHRFGTGDERVASCIAAYGERIEKILSAREGLRVVVLGDHGMCDVSSSIDLISMVSSLGLRVPDDYIPFYDSTMARFRVFSDRAGKALEELLSDCPCGRVLNLEELEALGVAFPDGRFGDLVFLNDPGSIILPSFMGKETVAGMHGYHPDAAGMYSVMFTNDDFPEDGCSICDAADFLLPGFSTGGGEVEA